MGFMSDVRIYNTSFVFPMLNVFCHIFASNRHACTHTYTHTHTHTHTHTRMHASTHARTHAHTHTQHTQTHTNTHTHTPRTYQILCMHSLAPGVAYSTAGVALLLPSVSAHAVILY